MRKVFYKKGTYSFFLEKFQCGTSQKRSNVMIHKNGATDFLSKESEPAIAEDHEFTSLNKPWYT